MRSATCCDGLLLLQQRASLRLQRLTLITAALSASTSPTAAPGVRLSPTGTMMATLGRAARSSDRCPNPDSERRRVSGAAWRPCILFSTSKKRLSIGLRTVQAHVVPPARWALAQGFQLCAAGCVPSTQTSWLARSFRRHGNGQPLWHELLLLQLQVLALSPDSAPHQAGCRARRQRRSCLLAAQNRCGAARLHGFTCKAEGMAKEPSEASRAARLLAGRPRQACTQAGEGLLAGPALKACSQAGVASSLAISGACSCQPQSDGDAMSPRSFKALKESGVRHGADEPRAEPVLQDVGDKVEQLPALTCGRGPGAGPGDGGVGALPGA